MGSDSPSTWKLLLLVIVVAAVGAVVVTLIQVLIMGKANAGITGAVVGAVSAGLVVTVWGSKSRRK